MNTLPPEILPLIIQHLYTKKDLLNCTKVNKAFYTATAPRLWRWYIEAASGTPQKILRRLETRHHPLGMYLRKLELWSSWADKDLVRLLPHLGRVEDFTIGGCARLDNAVIQQVPPHAPRLKTLRLWFIELTDGLVDALRQHCGQLEELVLHDCPDRTTGFFTTLIQGCPFNKLRVDMGAEFEQWQEHTLMDLTRVQGLKSLEFQIPSLVKRLVSIVATTPTWPLLTQLVIGHLGDLGDDELIPLIKARPRLQSLALQKSRNLTPTALDVMVKYLPDLTHVDVENAMRISVDDIRRMVKNCPRLVFVDVYECLFSTADFPEASDTDVDWDEYDLDGYPLIMSLDHSALCKIRLAK